MYTSNSRDFLGRDEVEWGRTKCQLTQSKSCSTGNSVGTTKRKLEDEDEEVDIMSETVKRTFPFVFLCLFTSMGPKRPSGPYIYFCKEFRTRCTPMTRVLFCAVAKATWKELPPEQKQRYQALSAADKARYGEVWGDDLA